MNVLNNEKVHTLIENLFWQISFDKSGLQIFDIKVCTRKPELVASN